MKISVKILFGEERPFEVSSEMSVFELKAMVTEKCNIPLAKQKLLLNGRALVDNKKLSEYDIQEGTKLNVFVCQTSQTKAAEKPTAASLHELLFEKLKMFWSDEDAKKVADEFLRSLNEKLYAMSLDDVERLAMEMMEEEEVAAEAAAASDENDNASPNTSAQDAANKASPDISAQTGTVKKASVQPNARVKDGASATGQGNSSDDLVD